MNVLSQNRQHQLWESDGSLSSCTGSESCSTENYASSNSRDASDGLDSGFVQSELQSDSVEEQTENQPGGRTRFSRPAPSSTVLRRECFEGERWGGDSRFSRDRSHPADRKARNMEWKKGMRVEVHSSEDGYGGAWFEGVIRSVTTDGQCCKIRYDKFVTEDGKPLEEEVGPHSEVTKMRPIPPRIQLPSRYTVREAVEAYDTDCWWRGVVIKPLKVEEEELWMVHFPDTWTFKAYPHSDLRPAQEWLGGDWISVPQERSPMIDQVIRSFNVENSMEIPLKSGGEGVGKKRGQAVKCKSASLAGGSSAKKKKLKVTVNTTVSGRQPAQEGAEIHGFRKNHGWRAPKALKRDGIRAALENDSVKLKRYRNYSRNGFSGLQETNGT